MDVSFSEDEGRSPHVSGREHRTRMSGGLSHDKTSPHKARRRGEEEDLFDDREVSHQGKTKERREDHEELQRKNNEALTEKLNEKV